MVRSLSDDASTFREGQQAVAVSRTRGALESWLAKEFDCHGDSNTVATLTVTLRHSLIPNRPTIEASRRLLKVVDDVLEFGPGQEFQTKAMSTLGLKYRRRLLKLTPTERAVITATRAIRNAVAHASARALARMNASIGDPALPAVLRAAGPIGRDGIGRYLCQTGPGSTAPRLLHYLELLKNVAYVLEPKKGRRPSML
jgi:hypothetical protein